MAKFVVNKKYSGRFVSNGKLVTVEIIKRTKNTVTINDLLDTSGTSLKKCFIKVIDGRELFYPLCSWGLTIRA